MSRCDTSPSQRSAFSITSIHTFVDSNRLDLRFADGQHVPRTRARYSRRRWRPLPSWCPALPLAASAGPTHPRPPSRPSILWSRSHVAVQSECRSVCRAGFGLKRRTEPVGGLRGASGALVSNGGPSAVPGTKSRAPKRGGPECRADAARG